MSCSPSPSNTHLIVSLLFLIVSSWSKGTFMAAEGRSLSGFLEKGMEEEKTLVTINLIGSRPPRCEIRCRSRPHCEAIQVPITTQSKIRHFSAAMFSVAY